MAVGSIKFVRISRTGAGTQTIEAAPGAGLKHVVTAFGLDTTAVTSLPQFESPAATVVAGPFGSALGFIGAAGDRANPLFEGAVNGALLLVTAGAGNTTGFIAYYTTQA